jgi:hypothetical protein
VKTGWHSSSTTQRMPKFGMENVFQQLSGKSINVLKIVLACLLVQQLGESCVGPFSPTLERATATFWRRCAYMPGASARWLESLAANVQERVARGRWIPLSILSRLGRQMKLVNPSFICDRRSSIKDGVVSCGIDLSGIQTLPLTQLIDDQLARAHFRQHLPLPQPLSSQQIVGTQSATKGSQQRPRTPNGSRAPPTGCQTRRSPPN